MQLRAPLRFVSRYISPVWSGVRINRYRGLPDEPCYGESFDISAHDGLENILLGDAYQGITLREYLERYRLEVMGACRDDGVLQVISMDAREHLSVQVHPDEWYAQHYLDDHEKTEAWYILAADEDAKIICGTTCFDIHTLRLAALNDTIGELYGAWMSVQTGDMILIKAGTLHALGKGICALEVGSQGFQTFRLCDWGRGRKLHRDEGFAVLKPFQRAEKVSCGIFDPHAACKSVRAVNHELFTCDVVDIPESYSIEKMDTYQIVSCVAGIARVYTPDGSTVLRVSDSTLIPYAASQYKVQGPCRIVRSCPVV